MEAGAHSAVLVVTRSKVVYWEPAKMRYKDDTVLLFLNYYKDITLTIAAAIVT